MTSRPTVLIVGATGETGTDIFNGLVEDGGFDIRIFARTASAKGTAVSALRNKGFPIIVGDLDESVEDLAAKLRGIDIVVSAIGPSSQLDQLRLADAASAAGVKRFVPCGFITIAPRGDVMLIRDEKEVVHDHIFRAKLPFTVVDVGYWHQLSFPNLPSGKIAYASVMPENEIYGDGNAPTLLTDKRDIGRFVARIIRDPRTLNKRVITWGAELSQNQIHDLMERLSGEKLPRQYVSDAECLDNCQEAVQAWKADPSDIMKQIPVWMAQYIVSKYVRADNTLENAKYLGYVDARELYPDFKPVSFEDYLGEVLAGKAQRAFAKAESVGDHFKE